uniref:Uncharacterized protein n=1 Tax=Strongyloides venezuelensis TaxID=75913 RepID=A0A0K0FNZ8_STRVS
MLLRNDNSFRKSGDNGFNKKQAIILVSEEDIFHVIMNTGVKKASHEKMEHYCNFKVMKDKSTIFIVFVS